MVYWKNGNVREVSNWEYGIEQDSAFMFHENGNLHKRAFSVDGKVEGKVYRYYKNGNVELIGNFDKSVRNGKWEYFDPATGELMKIEHYENGILLGH